MLRKMLLISLNVLLVVLFMGCGDDDALVVASNSSSFPLELVIVGNENGQVVVNSSNEEVRTEEKLQEIIEIAAREGRTFKTELVMDPLSEKAGCNLQDDIFLAPPRSSLVRMFISDIVVVRDGMAVTLTDLGLSLGLSWQGAWTLACYTMFEYELQKPSCANWPIWYYNAVRAQARLEIYYHSLAFYYWHSPRFRTVNIVIGFLP